MSINIDWVRVIVPKSLRLLFPMMAIGLSFDRQNLSSKGKIFYESSSLAEDGCCQFLLDYH
jgi:hypothetical protein